ncbi:MAG: acetate kinase [Eubacteriales bacterium]|nr:acetate kinase [Eubacteriales bacterium]
MKILVINAGSSSLKYQLFDMDNGRVMAKGNCERIGIDGMVSYKRPDEKDVKFEKELKNHRAAIETVLSLLTDKEIGVIGSVDEIDAVGHRFAHGGEMLKESSILTKDKVKYLESIVELNPLHGPPAIDGLRACEEVMPDVTHVGVFDTSYYSTVGERAYIYPIPYELYEKYKIRRYGFHGTSHRYVAARAAEMLGKDKKDLKIITCHLGNGSSITATDGGKAVDTSMGFTPQDGVPMGTRSGSLDPTVVTYIMKKLNMSADETEKMLNSSSGLLGISGVSSDCRNICEEAEKGNVRAKLALDILVHNIKKIIGSYIAEMNGVDALVFTAGIGENDVSLRSRVCENMDYLGIKINSYVNANAERGKDVDISAEGARVKTLVIPTNEEYMIALDTQNLVNKNSERKKQI